jgi:hypothetical protein
MYAPVNNCDSPEVTISATDLRPMSGHNLSKDIKCCPRPFGQDQYESVGVITHTRPSFSASFASPATLRHACTVSYIDLVSPLEYIMRKHRATRARIGRPGAGKGDTALMHFKRVASVVDWAALSSSWICIGYEINAKYYDYSPPTFYGVLSLRCITIGIDICLHFQLIASPIYFPILVCQIVL